MVMVDSLVSATNISNDMVILCYRPAPVLTLAFFCHHYDAYS